MITRKKGGNPRSFALINNFIKALSKNGLSSLKSGGPAFTWDNKRNFPNIVLERLDRFVPNSSWIAIYANYRTSNLDFFGSDNRPVKLITDQPHCNLGLNCSKAFNFNHHWLLEDEYQDLISSCWSSGSSSSPLPAKLPKLSEALSFWVNSQVDSLDKDIKKLRHMIDNIRENPTSEASCDQLGSLEAKLEKLLHKEEIYWKQRSRVNWLNEGDCNTAFFHKTASAR